LLTLNFTDNSIIIEGIACNLNMEGVGLKVRVTKNIDIIMVVEPLNPGFLKMSWQK